MPATTKGRTRVPTPRIVRAAEVERGDHQVGEYQRDGPVDERRRHVDGADPAPEGDGGSRPAGQRPRAETVGRDGAERHCPEHQQREPGGPLSSAHLLGQPPALGEQRLGPNSALDVVMDLGLHYKPIRTRDHRAAQQHAVGAQEGQRLHRAMPAPLQGGGGGVAVEVDRPAAVGLLPARPAGRARRRPRPARTAPAPARPGTGRSRAGRMNSSSAPPATCSSPSGGTCRRERSASSSAASRVRASGGVEELDGEGELHRVRGVAQAGDRVEAERPSPGRATGAPATAGSSAATRVAVATTTAVICSEDDVAVRPRPERRAGRRDRAPAARTAARRRAA